MTSEEMDQRCKEAIKLTGPKTTWIVAHTISGLLFDIKEWNEGDGYNKDEMELQIGRCMIALRMLQYYIGANPVNVVKGMEEVISN